MNPNPFNLFHKRNFSHTRPCPSADFDPFLKIVSLQHNPSSVASQFKSNLEKRLYSGGECSREASSNIKFSEKATPDIIHYKSKSRAESISRIPSQTDRILLRNKLLCSKSSIKKEHLCMKTLQLKFNKSPTVISNLRIHHKIKSDRGKLSVVRYVRRKTKNFEQSPIREQGFIDVINL